VCECGDAGATNPRATISSRTLGARRGAISNIRMFVYMQARITQFLFRRLINIGVCCVTYEMF